MPGNSPGMLQDAAVLGSDGVIFDLEDAVSVAEKDSARILVREALRTIDYSSVETVVRVNPLDTEFGLKDMAAIAGAKPDAILIPKAQVEALQLADKILDQVEREEGYLPQSIQLLALIETAAGLENISSVIQASARVTGVLLGGEDLAADLGIVRTKEGEEIFYARSKVATVCRAWKIDGIDTPFTDTLDDEGLTKDTAKAKSLGMTGKAAVGPRQVAIIHAVFAPSEVELNHALRVLAAMAEAEREGRGVCALDGKMIDAPVLQRAKATVRLAENLGILARRNP